MIEQEMKILSLLIELKHKTEQLLEIDIEEEQEIPKLNALQQEQEILSQRLAQFQPALLNDQIRRVASECQQLETLFNAKLINFQKVVKTNISKIELMKQHKHAYQNQYLQAEGYFIDNRK
ncbi:hypothetical protein HQN90_28625 [Paenibacillus alba]|uniref:hypothetical protein n=1 Tax=Paenibacillus alba TaxID=1197127 RepID=UPI001565C560|nr:hypothetical protein [Paenibacillus alba]NQX70107.1 hypothetical protein [Paenibacillus alba]